jgi:hypothetical protein
MLTYAKKLVATTLVSSTLVLGGLAPMATAAQPVFQDGLVNVNVYVNDVLDVTLSRVNVAVPVAANVAANLCDIDVGPVALAVLGQATAVDRSGRERTVCVNDAGQEITLSQNN